MTAQKSPDPVAEARAYRQLLLSLLGDDDPAAVQSQTENLVRDLIRDAGANLRRRPVANQWSVLELLGHLADGELVLSSRYRWTLSQDHPPLLGYDQDAWVAGLRHNDDDPDELLRLFSSLRETNLRLWRRSNASERARVAMHAERGPESYDLMFRMLAGHDRFHLEQMRATLRQIRDSG